MKVKKDLAKEKAYPAKNLWVHYAIESGDLKAVKYFNNMDPNSVDEKNDSGTTPLEVAAFEGNIEICKFLIEKGANVNNVSNEGVTPLFQAIDQSESHEVVKLLLENGADPNLMCGTEGQQGFPLDQACLRGQIEIVKELIKHGAKVNAVDEYDCSALATAVAREKPEITKLLLKHGADINKGKIEGLNIVKLSKESDQETHKLIANEVLKRKVIKKLSSKEQSLEI